jgi:hypothetical protein
MASYLADARTLSLSHRNIARSAGGKLLALEIRNEAIL